MANIFALTQRAFRFYEDGTEAGSVEIAAENANITRLAVSNSALLLRVGFSETGSGAISGATTDDYQLQYSKNGGAFTNVTAVSSNVRGFASASLTDAGTTTNRLSAGGGSFVAGEISEVGLVTDRQLTANNFTEMLYAIEIVAADVAANDTLDFRVLLNGATTNVTYSVTPQITVSKATVLTAGAATLAMIATVASLVAGAATVQASPATTALATPAAVAVAGLPPKPASGSTINTGHSLASGLVRCILYNEGTGSPTELVGAGSGTLTGGAAWATDAGLGGTCLDTSSATGDGVNWGANGLSAGNGDVSFFFAGRIPTVAARDHIAVELAGGTTEGLFFGIGDSGQPKFVIADVADLSSGAAVLSTGVIYTMGAAYDRGTSVRYHVKNQSTGNVTTDTVSSAATPTSTSNPSTTSNRRGFTAGWDDRIAFVYVWNRVLSDSEFQELHANPYAFIDEPAGGLAAVPATCALSTPTATVQPGSVTLSPATASVGLAAPTATATSSLTLSASAASLGLAAPTATAQAGSVTRTAASATAALSTPSATAQAGASTRVAVAATIGLAAPSATANSSLTLSSAVATVSIAAPAAVVQPGSATASATVATIGIGAPQATPQAGSVTVASTQATVALSAPTATAIESQVLDAQPATVGLSVPAVTVQAGSSAVSATAATVGISTPTPTVQATVTLATTPGTVALSTPTSTLFQIQHLQATPATVACGAPTVTAAAGSVSVSVDVAVLALATPTALVLGGAELPDSIIVASLVYRGSTHAIVDRGVTRSLVFTGVVRTVEFAG